MSRKPVLAILVVIVALAVCGCGRKAKPEPRWGRAGGFAITDRSR